MTSANTAMQLQKTSASLCGGGTARYQVFTPEGECVGGVADYRDWQGHAYGGRRWLVWHRKHGDTAARWNSDGYRTRKDAVAALAEAVGTGENMEAEKTTMTLVDRPMMVTAAHSESGRTLKVSRSVIVKDDHELYVPVRGYIHDHGLVLAASETFEDEGWYFGTVEVSTWVASTPG